MLKKTLWISLCLLFAVSLLLPLVRGNSPLDLGLDLAGGAMVTYRPDFDRVPEPYADLSRQELLALAKETLVGRLLHRFDTLPDVVISGDDRLIVSLPGEQDQRKILETVGETYRMTFRRALAVHDAPPESPQGLVLPYAGRWYDLGEELLSGEMLDPRSIGVQGADGAALQDIGRGAAVTFEFRSPYDDRFAEITRQNLGGTLAILLDDDIEWAGRVEQEIDGAGVLQGGYSAEEASQVASLLRSGNLPVSLDIESMSAVGPSLGQEILEQGQRALLLSVGALLLLLLVAYGHRPALLLTGWFSLAALLFFILGMISLFGLTVDLVAIAGLVLSVGMGMDAFILVFEAMEHETTTIASPNALPSRQGPLARLRRIYSFGGEGRTLVHANATTLLVILLLFASDRLKSFALFLGVGILASLMTIWLTKGLLERFARREKSTAAGSSRHDVARRGFWSPLAWVRGARPGLFRWRHLYFAGLAVFALFALVQLNSAAAPGGLVLGNDFQPGMQLRVELPDGGEIESLVDDLRATFPGVAVRHQAWRDAGDSSTTERGTTERGYVLTLEGRAWEDEEHSEAWRSESSAGALAAGEATMTPAHLSDWLAQRQVTTRQIHAIDARLSGQRILTSLSVLGFSFLLLAFYLRSLQPRIDGWLTPAGRPKPTAAGMRIFLGTLLAVLIDVAVVLTSLAWLGIPIGMPVIAALLTIVGYSVNDSMVLWSHLSQPGRSSDPSATSRERISLGVDKILSRTLLTSLSTMVPALVILWVGLEPLRGFAWAVLIGTVAGTLSSMFVVASFAAAGAPQANSSPDAHESPERAGFGEDIAA